MDSKSESRQWKDFIEESVHTSDDIDIGDIEAVSKSFVVVKRGLIKVHYYYIPLSRQCRMQSVAAEFPSSNYLHPLCKIKLDNFS